MCVCVFVCVGGTRNRILSKKEHCAVTTVCGVLCVLCEGSLGERESPFSHPVPCYCCSQLKAVSARTLSMRQ